MSTATVTRKLRALGHPVEMVRGAGYHYFIFDDGDFYDSVSVMIPRFRSWPVERWVAEGAAFAKRCVWAKAEAAERDAERGTGPLKIGGR